jgi:hypothetical protein
MGEIKNTTGEPGREVPEIPVVPGPEPELPGRSAGGAELPAEPPGGPELPEPEPAEHPEAPADPGQPVS